MTSVIRIKRRIDEDPAETLRLSCKRQRQEAKEDSPLEIDSVLSFAGTLHSKDEPVSSHIREAIRKTKLHKELHPHSTGFKHNPHKSKVTRTMREETEALSRKNRYRVTWRRRALDLSELDFATDQSDTGQDVSADEKSDPQTLQALHDSENQKESKHITTTKTTTRPLSPARSPQSLAAQRSDCACSSSKTSRTHGYNSGVVSKLASTDPMFCIMDVEAEDQDDLFEQARRIKETITVNDKPMMSTKAPLAESEYVYDLYYTHARLDGLHTDAVLTVQSLCQDFVQEEVVHHDGEDLVYDDDDDSNDESNWRNDYPDEDPHFFENEDAESYYTEDLLYSNALDDGGDLLAYFMDAQCRVGEASDDDDDHYSKEALNSSDDSNIDF